MDSQPTSKVLKTGFLKKRSKYLHLWKTRFCILTNKHLFAFTGIEKDADCTMTLLLENCIETKKAENELRKDAYSLLEVFDKLTVSEDNHFTVDDIEAALSMYNEDYVTFPRDNIARVTNLYIKQNKRNGRKQAVHMQIMRATRDILYPNGEWRNVAGRPTKEIEIRNYMHAHPDATKSDIKKELNISYDTIRKYYDKIKAEL